MRGLRIATAALALAGAAVAGYLTWVHYAALEPFCVGGGQACERVQTSSYAEFAGIPVALLGLVAYLAVLASLALPEAAGRPLAAFLTLTGLAFSGYLTYLEIAEIHAICQWCVASAVIMTALAVVSVVRLLRVDEQPALR
jgi:uncharacterized membrane protein